MKKWLSLLLLLIIPFGLQAKYVFDETIYVPLPQNIIHKWKMGHQKADEEKGSCVTRYVLETETATTWTQLLNIQFKNKDLIKTDSAEAAMKEEAAKSTQVTYKIHSQNPHDILYERDFPTGEHELVRMIMTKKGLHRIAYVKRGPLTNAERVQWIDRLSKGMIGGKEG